MMNSWDMFTRIFIQAPEGGKQLDDAARLAHECTSAVAARAAPSGASLMLANPKV